MYFVHRYKCTPVFAGRHCTLHYEVHRNVGVGQALPLGRLARNGKGAVLRVGWGHVQRVTGAGCVCVTNCVVPVQCGGTLARIDCSGACLLC